MAYVQNRSLWYDEAALALNLARRGFIGLLGPLDNLQAAPPLFLWIERVVVSAFGFNEWVLRAVPLAAGIVTGPLMWRVARRLLPPPAAVLAVAFVTLSPVLVRYASEVKPYGVDTLITLLIVDRALAATQLEARSTDWWMLAGIGVIALVSSTPAGFVLAGVIACLLLRAAMTRNGALARHAFALSAGWALTIAVLLATVYRPLLIENVGIGTFMQWYWSANFLTPDPPGLVTKVSVLAWAVLTDTFLGDAAFPGATSLALATLALGAVMLVARRRLAELALLVVPIVALLIASALRLYPAAERLVLFATPLCALLLASSLLVFVRRDGRVRSTWLVALPTAAVAIVALRGVEARLSSDEGREESRELVRIAMQEHVAGKSVWVSGGGEAAWRIYSGQIESENTSTEAGPLSPAGRSIAPGVLVGAWFRNVPERILPTPSEAAADSTASPWSENEARRVRGMAEPCVLLFLSQTPPSESASLLTSVGRLGGRVAQSRRAPGAMLHDVCFATAADVSSQ